MNCGRFSSLPFQTGISVWIGMEMSQIRITTLISYEIQPSASVLRQEQILLGWPPKPLG